MQKQILVSDAYHRDRRTEKEIRQPGQQFIEIDDQVRSRFPDAPPDIAHTLNVFGRFPYIIQDAPAQISTPIGTCRQEVRAYNMLDRRLNTPDKESRKPA